VELVVADIGGTHARFALAQIRGQDEISLDFIETLRCADHSSLASAWDTYASKLGRKLPRLAALALATPVQGEVLKMTNNPWVIQSALLPVQLDLDRHVLINDFGAVAHAVQVLGPGHFADICGPQGSLPGTGLISVIGPGTGLGLACLRRTTQGSYEVIETEGGHVDFAPRDALEDAILSKLRGLHTRVSVERIVSGPGLSVIHSALGEFDNRSESAVDDVTLWARALDGTDSRASAALDRLCQCLGAVAGDFALAQGAKAVVIAGGLGMRLSNRLKTSGFIDRFTDKGRLRDVMESMPVKLVTHAQPGLVGAAAAFARTYCS